MFFEIGIIKMKLPALQFFLAFPAAMFLTGALMERFQVLSLLASIALKFRAVSAAIWDALFTFMNLKISYNPDILSIYFLLLIPVVVDYFRGKFSFGKEDNILHWYLCGCIAIVLIFTGYQIWAHVFETLINMAKLSLAGFWYSLIIVIPVYIIFNLIFKNPVKAVCFSWLFLLVFAIMLIALNALEINLFAFIGLPNNIANTLENYMRWETFALSIFWIFSIILFLIAPFTKTPIFVVVWTIMFIISDWFSRGPLPAIKEWIEAA